MGKNAIRSAPLAMQEKLNQLLEKHCVTIKNNVELLGAYLKRAREEDDLLQALNDAAALAHQLKGSSGTAGFHDICVAATALNGHLSELTARGEAHSHQDLQRVIELYDKLSSVSQAAHPQSSALYFMAQPLPNERASKQNTAG